MTLSFYRHGHGDTRVLAAHSWVGSGVTFAPLLPHLDPEQFTWVFASFDGYGPDASGPDHADIATMGSELIGLADHLGWDTFHLVGHSMGGQAVQSALADTANVARVLSASLISSVPAAGFPVDGETQATFEAAARTSDAMRQVLLHLASGDAPEAMAEYILALSRATSSPEVLAAYLRAWTRDDVSDGVDSYTGPVLVISGADDPALGPAVADGIAATFTNARHVPLAGVGHFPPLEAPSQVAEVVTEHIAAATTRTDAKS